MSDTDSAVLTRPLPKHLVGNKLGQMRLVQEIKKGIFIRKKLYYILNKDDQVLIVSSGLDSSKLNYNMFLNLLNGESVEIETTKFNVDWKTLDVNVVKSKLVVQALKGKIKTIYNTPDVNYRFVSFPIKYSIIIHPLFPYEVTLPIVLNLKQEYYPETAGIKKENLINGDSDIFVLFSKIEISFFIISLFLFSVFIIIYIFYYK